jgi:hypothetical protein
MHLPASDHADIKSTGHHKLLQSIVTLCAFALLGSPAYAQLSGKGEIKGVVTDPSGAVVAHASVTATSVTRGIKSTQTTSAAGDYDISPLDPDNYTVTVAAAGFQTVTQQNVNVNALEISNVNVTLTVGAESESITVSTAPPAIETSNATLGATMEQAMYAALPIQMGNGNTPDQRRATDFATLMPGVQGNETSGNATTNVGVINGSGSRGAAAAVYVNGIPFTSVAGEGDTRFVWTAISVDAVNQFQVQTTGYSALYEGQGVENFTVKSGTNSYHGAAYEYFRNTFLDTWGFFSPAFLSASGKPSKPTEHQNEYGIVLSGPILKNRLFLFGNYDAFRFSHGPQPIFQTIPTTAEQNGDFSAIAHIYDPRTTTCVGSNCTRQEFSNDFIPLSLRSQVARNLQQYLPIPTNLNSTNNYLAGFKSGLSNWNTANRIDWIISQRHNLSFVGAFGRQASIGPASQTSQPSRNQGPVPYNYGQEYAPKTVVLIFQDTFTFSPHIVNQFNYGFGRYNGPTFNSDLGSPHGAAENGITGLPAGQVSDAFPIVTFSGIDAPTTWAGAFAKVQIANSYDLIDNLQWIVGRHSLTFGGEIAWLQYQNLSATTGTTQLTIANTQNETANYIAGTSTLNTATGVAYASFLTGAPDNMTFTQNAYLENGARFRPISPYVQDDWKVNTRLTVNLGLRWDFYPTYVEQHNQLSFLNPTLVNPVTGNMGALQFAGSGSVNCNCSTNVSNYYKNFGPRIGLAFQSDPKTVWRASWGVMYTHGNGVGGSSASTTGTGTQGFSANPTAQATNGVPRVYLDSGFPAYTAPPFLNSGYGTGYSTNQLQSPQAMSYGDPYLGGRAPEYINWSFGFQHQLSDTITMTVSYVGSQGHFELPDTSNARGQWINQLNPQYLSLGAALSNKATPAALAAAGVTAPYPSFDPSQTIAQSLKPFQQYNSISDTYGNIANSNYNALQVSVMKRPSKGLQFMANYTWSRAIDDGGTFRSGYAIPAQYSNTGRSYRVDAIERAESTTSQPQHAVVTGVYDLPFGTAGFGADKRWVRILAGGYKFSAIYQAYSGSPLPLTGSNCGFVSTVGAAGTCEPTYTPGFTGQARINGAWGDGVLANNTSRSFISPNAFINTPSTAASPIFGNVSRTAPYGIIGPGNYSLDISLRRSFGLGREGAHLLLEADLYNVTNHTLFGGIATTVGNSNFGTVSTQANLSRDAQLTARIEF